MTGSAIIPVEDLANKFPALGDPDMMEALNSNLGDDSVSVFELDRVKIPGAAGVTWEVPGLDGPTGERELIGVIIGIIPRRSYWEVAVEDQSEPAPPDCSSDDGKTGRGLFGIGSAQHPSGTCADCPMNEFVEVNGRNTKPCKEQRLVLFLREGAVLPVVIQLPPTSIKLLKTYMLRLASSSTPYYRALTSLKLTKVEGSPSYSVINPTLQGRLDKESADKLFQLGKDVIAAYTAQSSSAPAADA